MNGEVTLDPARIRTHADVIDATAAKLVQARGAASHIILGPQAYGVLCQALPLLLTGMHDDYLSVMDKLGDALEKHADTLRTFVNDVEKTDGDNAEGLDTVPPK